MIRQKSFGNDKPTLFLVPTPIGNLNEMTPRAKETLEACDVIACEDTRNTKKLLSLFGIEKPLISHHEHNQEASIPGIIELLRENKNVAIVSDAGYPLVSDPGARLVQEVIAQDFNVVSMSGANAAMNALVASGLSCQPYVFYGFLDHKSSKRKQQLEELQEIPYTIIFYEAPHRIEDMLADVLEVFGDRKMCLARELTKMHEEYIRGNVSEVVSVAGSCKGEMVVVIEGKAKEEKAIDWDEAIEKVTSLVNEGYKTKQAIVEVAKALHISKNELYQKVHHQ